MTKAIKAMEAELCLQDDPSRSNNIQKASPNLQQKSDALFVIKEAAGKGLGMFATRRIEKGTLLLAERAVIFADIQRFCYADIQNQYDHLEYTQKVAYMSLQSNHDPQDTSLLNPPTIAGVRIDKMLKRFERRILAQGKHVFRTSGATPHSVFMTNYFSISPGAVVCLKASRINHSCRPNAYACWNDESKQLEVRLFCAVEANEEITLDYLRSRVTGPERRGVLAQFWSFTCKCISCEGAGADENALSKADLVRKEIRQMEEKVLDESNLMLLPKRCKQQDFDFHYHLLRLYEQERYITETVIITADSVSLLARRFDNPDIAVHAAALRAHIAKLLFGPSHQKFKSALRRQEEVREWVKERRFRAAAEDVLRRLDNQGH